MYVCMSVTGLRTSLARATHDAIAMEVEVENSEERRRRQNESRGMEDS